MPFCLCWRCDWRLAIGAFTGVMAGLLGVGGGIFMLILGALLGIAAFWKISRSGISGNKAVAVFLTLGAVTFTLSGGQVLQQAIADNTTSLSNPNGGTVDVYSDYQEYVNASGVPLVITAVNGPCNIPAAQKAKDGGQGVQADSKTQVISLPYCKSGLALEENGNRCYTYFQSCN